MQQNTGKKRSRVGVTLVTGYLGAGKTTLINYILKNCGSQRIAVIENEFGEINIDQTLVAENIQSKELLIALDKGCVCCSLREDLVNALGELMKRSEDGGVDFDYVLLETTGLADPGPVAFTFFANKWVQKHFYLDAIVTVVDAKYTVLHLNEDRGNSAINEAVQQIAFADILLLNKIDLLKKRESVSELPGSCSSDQEEVSEEEYNKRINEIRDQVRKINTEAKLLEVQITKPGTLPSVDEIVGVKAFSMDRVLSVDPNFFESDDEEEENEGKQTEQNDGRDQQQEECKEQPKEPVRKGLLAQKFNLQNQLQQPDNSDNNNMPSSTAKEYLQPKKRRKTLHDLSGVATVGVTARGYLDRYRFDMFMKDLLTEKGTDIFRTKGVVAIKDHKNAKFVFQGVHETFQYSAIKDDWDSEEQPVNRIVLIGKNLDRKALKEGFRSCVWVPLPEGWTQHRHLASGRPYYVNNITGQKTWERQALFCPIAFATTLVSAEQPLNLQPGARPSADSNTGISSQTNSQKNAVTS